MASPITSIHRKKLSETELQQKKIEELQSLIAEQQDSLQKMIEIASELNDAGVLDAVAAMIKAREKLAEIAVTQASREPVTNLMNHLLNAVATLSSIDPAATEKLIKAMKNGIEEAELYRGNDDRVSILQVMTALNDPEVNQAVKYGMDFLKGMGKELNRN